MQQHHDTFFSIFFGTQEHSYVPRTYQGLAVHVKKPFDALPLRFEQLVFLHQTHGAGGKVIRLTDTDLVSFVHDGDYLLTQVPRTGLGISTADCLPIVLADPITKAIGIVHAGWKGSAQGIVGCAVKRMGEEYGSKPADIQAYFGPSALACCYEVQPSFKENLIYWPHAPFFERHGKLYFDVTAFNTQQLQETGVTNINRAYQQCTICSPGFCSVRKAPLSPERQLTVVAIR